MFVIEVSRISATKELFYWVANLSRAAARSREVEQAEAHRTVAASHYGASSVSTIARQYLYHAPQPDESAYSCTARRPRGWSRRGFRTHHRTGTFQPSSLQSESVPIKRLQTAARPNQAKLTYGAARRTDARWRECQRCS